MRPALILLLLPLLAACASPMERCVSQATAPLRSAERELSRLETVLARGYAIRTKEIPTYRPELCRDSDGKIRTCFEWDEIEIETIERVDLFQVRRRADDIRARLPALQASADAGAAQCRTLLAETAK